MFKEIWLMLLGLSTGISVTLAICIFYFTHNIYWAIGWALPFVSNIVVMLIAIASDYLIMLLQHYFYEVKNG